MRPGRWVVDQAAGGVEARPLPVRAYENEAQRKEQREYWQHHAGGYVPVATRLPTRGTIYSIDSRQDLSTSRPVTLTNQIIDGHAGLVRYVPESLCTVSHLVFF